MIEYPQLILDRYSIRVQTSRSLFFTNVLLFQLKGIDWDKIFTSTSRTPIFTLTLTLTLKMSDDGTELNVLSNFILFLALKNIQFFFFIYFNKKNTKNN